MTLSLTAADQARFANALRTILSAHDFADASTWATAAGEAVRGLVSADSALVVLPGQVFIEGSGLPDTFRSAYHYHFEGAMRGQATEDPLALEFVRRRREAAVDTVDFAGVNRLLGGQIQRSTFHHDAFVAGGIRDMHALYADAIVGGQRDEVAITACFASPVRGHRGAEGLAMLRMLKPAFQAGMETWFRLDARAASLTAALDGFGVALAVVDLAGRVRHHSPALTDLLQAEPERERIVAAMRAAGSAVTWAYAPDTHGAGAPPSPALDVTTAAARYHVRATDFGEDALGAEPAAVVLVERAVVAEAAYEAIGARFGLTRQEVRVARMLAQRQTTREIAAALFISVHTARHHVEHVLEKLGVRARAEVSAVLSGR